MTTSKADTLIKIQGNLKNFNIPEIYVFKVKDWNNNKKIIIKEIQEKFANKRSIAIRSSSSFEDNHDTSAAGMFESFLNIDPKKKKNLKKLIIKVIKSYKKYSNQILNEQIFVQEMITNIKMSGVIFTGNFLNNNLYYYINYDDITGLTNTITSGSSTYSNKTLYILKDRADLIRSKRFKLIVKATREVENFFKDIPLDIEFGLSKKNRLYLFQVRPIVTKYKKKKIEKKSLKKKIQVINDQLKKYLIINQKNLSGKITLLSQMSDWNPAEMIGQYPSNLSYSLYEKLITKKNWLKARKIMGYKSFKDSKLMYNIGGRPYIDVRKSLNSFLPKDLPKKVSHNLVEYGIQRIKKKPELHDKIEFSLSPTCFTFDFDQKILSILGKKKNRKISKNLKEKFLSIFLKNLDKESFGSIENNLKKLQILKKLQNSYVYKVNGDLSNTSKIINQTIKYGIIPFAILARHGFIAKANLLSLVKKKIMRVEELSKFEKSISTITSEFLDDQNNINKSISYKMFIKKYGHLRAGTYDINSKCYSELNKKLFINNKNNQLNYRQKNFTLSKNILKKIDALIKKNNIDLNSKDLINYFKNSISSREYGKFIFTKSISVILQNIKIFAKENKIKLDDIEHLSINDIIKFKKNCKVRLLKIIKKNKFSSKINKQISLPEIIVEETNAYVGASVVSVPNFVTNEIVDSDTIYLGKGIDNLDIHNKIVMIDNADPGYDWIFGYKINGLITQYGGANSHMTIRCNELNIPAAIGCGEPMFKNLLNEKKLSLNCKNKVIRTSQNI